MRRMHVAFFTVPRRPHVNPTLPIVSRLVRNGHRVTYVTSDKFAHRVTDAGGEVCRCQRFPPQYPTLHLDPFCDLAARTLSAVIPIYEKQRPDVIVYDSRSFAGRILAARSGVPAIRTDPCFAYDKENIARQAGPLHRGLVMEHARTLDLFLERNGIPGGDFLFYRESLNIYLYPRIFQLEGNAFDETCFYAGCCAGEQPYEGRWNARNAGGLPIILVAASSTYVQDAEYYRSIISALLGLKAHVVMSIGDDKDPAYFDPLPPHFEIIQNVSHDQVLSHARILICLGGMLASVEAAYYGVPMIVIDIANLDAGMYAANAVRLGFARAVRKTDSFEKELRESVIEVICDEHMLNRARCLQRIVREEGGGSEEVTDRIEEFVEIRRGMSGFAGDSSFS